MVGKHALKQQEGTVESAVLPLLELQREASNPQASIWVDASAGTGKTKVLTDRVLRFLLDGVQPGKILCLTYTKAAAAEMLLRLQTRLSCWATCPDATLVAELTALNGTAPQAHHIHQARQLFYDLIDDPYGLRILTIHSFCQQILTKFPTEAGLAGGFTLIDDAERQNLLECCFDRFLAKLTTDPALKSAFATVQPYYTPGALIESLHDTLLDPKVRQNLHTFDCQAYQAQLRGHMALNACEQPFMIDRDRYGAACDILRQGGVQDQKAAALIETLLQQDAEIEQPAKVLECLKSLFLTATDEVRKRLAAKKLLEQHPWLEAFFVAEAESLILAIEEEKKRICLAVSTALMQLAQTFLTLYQGLKAERHVLDFEDLIDKTAGLLQQQDGISWVLYKLDGGIDHLLIDEAQDSSPSQWQIITLLASDFFSGQGHRNPNRTLFVVGDRKQSIYSFQGAEPDLFHHLKDVFAAQVQAAVKQWQHLTLNVSFRSAQAILDVVDATFQSIELAVEPHQAFRHLDGGAVELWPLISVGSPEIDAEEGAEDEGEPLQLRALSATKQLANLIARNIATQLQQKFYLAAKGRAVRPNDYLILVQRRSALMYEMIRALKKQGVPVAGPDRFLLNDHIAIQDLVALGNFVTHIEDDYALACALKSPLFNFDDQDLLALAPRRERYTLWSVLKKRQDENPRYQATYDTLARLINQAPHLTPYRFYHQILTHLAGRQNFFARLGSEVEDVLNEFLNQAFIYSKNVSAASAAGNGGHLQGFLSYLECVRPEIKRDFSSNLLQAVRIMTAHGAKGLQAPIVYLPDTTRLPSQLPLILWFNDQQPLPLWRAPAKQSCALVEEQKKLDKAKLMAEYDRLLYVAMTRAEDILVVCGYETERRTSEECWYEKIRRGLDQLEAPVNNRAACEPVERQVYTRPQQRLINSTEQQAAPLPAQASPGWLKENVKLELEASDPISPSQAIIYAQAIEDQSPLEVTKGTFLQTGTYVHKLLEVLPGLNPDAWKQAQQHFAHQYQIPEDLEVTQAVFDLLKDPAFHDIFTGSSHAEVAIAGTVAGQKFSGQIDRLIFTDDGIHLIDFKSNHEIPTTLEEVPKEYQIQLMIYYHLLNACYPDQKITCEIIWVRQKIRMVLPLDMLKDAEQHYLQERKNDHAPDA
jgi:double-strand break repair helicase AddA, alphaproteobacterial type